MAAETDRRPVDRDHQNDDNECNHDNGHNDDGGANDNEADVLDDKSVSHVFLPITRRTIISFLSLTYLNVRTHREEVPINGHGTSSRISPAKLPRSHPTISL